MVSFTVRNLFYLLALCHVASTLPAQQAERDVGSVDTEATADVPTPTVLGDSPDLAVTTIIGQPTPDTTSGFTDILYSVDAQATATDTASPFQATSINGQVAVVLTTDSDDPDAPTFIIVDNDFDFSAVDGGDSSGADAGVDTNTDGSSDAAPDTEGDATTATVDDASSEPSSA